jgi:hypothetical protein
MVGREQDRARHAREIGLRRRDGEVQHGPGRSRGEERDDVVRGALGLADESGAPGVDRPRHRGLEHLERGETDQPGGDGAAKPSAGELGEREHAVRGQECNDEKDSEAEAREHTHGVEAGDDAAEREEGRCVLQPERSDLDDAERRPEDEEAAQAEPPGR